MIENYETFSEEQESLLKNFVTSTSSNIFVLRNLPEVIKGALFSRYSRSKLGLRSLLLKDFIQTEESDFQSIASSSEGKQNDQIMAIQKAQSFYDRILDGYGDDSIGELGGAHLAIENITMIGAKILEDKRIGGSPLEKSTRYICFDEKIDGKYRYYRDPILMTSAFRTLYEKTCDDLFDTYSSLIAPLTEEIKKEFPYEEGSSKIAYNAALRAKVFDCVRGLLPASTLTNLGVFGNGRFFENLIRSLNNNSLTEMQDVAKKSYTELSKVIPSFVRRAGTDHPNQESFSSFTDTTKSNLKHVASGVEKEMQSEPSSSGVRLIDFDVDGVNKVIASLLFPHLNSSLKGLEACARKMSHEEQEKILEAVSSHRENRRHKSPRALERAEFTFEIVADFGAYRDLHRHRLLTQDRQLLTCNHGFTVPDEIKRFGFGAKYTQVMLKAKDAYDSLAKEFPEEAQYVVPMGYNIRWYFHLNLRALQWLCELRSSPAGHTSYRFVAQEMAKLTFDACPQFEKFFRFVDFEGHGLGRLEQEERKEKKRLASKS